MSSYSKKQIHQLMDALEESGFTPAHITKLSQYERLDAVRLVLDGLAQIVEVTRKEEVPLNTIVRIDRLTPPTYPSWADQVMNRELECTGPIEYDLAKSVSLWLHNDQKRGVVTGQFIYDYLKKHGMLTSCGSIQDALEIQKKGAVVFGTVFGHNVVHFWRSVVRTRDNGGLVVPYLCVDDKHVLLDWSWLRSDFSDCEPAVRFVDLS